MSKYFLLVMSVFTLVSCSKKDVSVPGTDLQSSAFYKDENIDVSEFNISQTASTAVTVNFKTVSENNIQKIELMSSGDTNNFCTIEIFYPCENSRGGRIYSFTDTKLKGNPMYYMLRFTYANGDWGYTPYYVAKLN